MSGLNSKTTPFERLLSGDVATLARAISILEVGGERADALATRLRGHAGKARIIGFTGPPGAGKSTLINAYVAALRNRGERIAVLAVDPSSPLSGGALLGDRTRMGRHSADPYVFIRSVAARGHIGGLALSIPAIMDAVDAAGWPTIILETVGAGQSENEIAEFADLKIVLNAPGLGDDIQAIKSGILEIADILVVNKSDLPLADRTVRQLRAMIDLRTVGLRDVPIVKTSAIEIEGIDDLEKAIADRLASTDQSKAAARRIRRLHGLLQRRAETVFRTRLEAIPSDKINKICNHIYSGTLSIDGAAANLVALAFEADMKF